MTKPPYQRYDTDLGTLKREVVIETYKSSGPGGQRKNKTETAVRLKHLPSGITIVATEHRSQSQNLKLALERLRKRLERLNRPRRPRLPTRIPKRAVETRIKGKKLKSSLKRFRQKPSGLD